MGTGAMEECCGGWRACLPDVLGEVAEHGGHDLRSAPAGPVSPVSRGLESPSYRSGAAIRGLESRRGRGQPPEAASLRLVPSPASKSMARAKFSVSHRSTVWQLRRRGLS